MTNLRFTVSDGSDLTIPISGIEGLTSGTLSGSFVISTLSVGVFSFEIWVMDSNGNSSNKLSANFKVKVDDRGIQWTERTSGTMVQLNGIGWDESQFIAVGSGGTILTSDDGIDWTQRISGTSNNFWSVTWSGTQLVTVGESGTILASPDGINWT